MVSRSLIVGSQLSTRFALAISATSRTDRQCLAGDPLHGLQHLQYGTALAAAQIEGARLAAVAQMLQRQHVRPAQIQDMHIVADAGAVRRVVIAAVHHHLRALAECRVQRQRDQMGFRFMPLAQPCPGIGPGGVEIAQGRPAQPVAVGARCQRLLDQQLRFAIRVDRLCGVILRDWYGFRLAIDRGGGGEHQRRRHIPRGQHIEEHQRAPVIILQIALRFAHRLAGLNEGREVENGIGPPLVQQPADQRRVADIAGDQPRATDRDRLFMAADEIVQDHDIMSGLCQHQRHLAADIASAAGDQDMLLRLRHGGSRLVLFGTSL